MSEWKKVRLGEAAVMKRGKYITRSDTRPGNIPVILGGQEPAYYCDEANHTGPCIVISRSGASAGFVSYWQQPIFVTDGFLFEAKEQSSIHYLYYCLKANQSLLGNLQNATAIPHVRGEDKIENNRKICANLEAQAQAIFKSWFVDFEPFGGKIPQGWKMGKLGDEIAYQEGPGIRNWQYVERGGTRFINIRCINDGEITTDTANMISNEEANGKYAHFMLKENDIVMSCSGTLGRYAVVRKCHLPLCLNTSVIRFYPKRDHYDFSWILGYLGSADFLEQQKAMANGSCQVNFGPTHLKQMQIVIPDKAVRKRYHEIVYPLICQAMCCKDESRSLAALRDALLPKLMSGEIDVEKVKISA